jgi:hypothetical protein
MLMSHVFTSEAMPNDLQDYLIEREAAEQVGHETTAANNLTGGQQSDDQENFLVGDTLAATAANQKRQVNILVNPNNTTNDL